MIRFVRATLALALLAGCGMPAGPSPVPMEPKVPVNTEPAAAIATWGEFSGSLPPEYAWDYTVTFADNRTVSARYCKGYADAAPGCAVVYLPISPADFDALQAALAPLGTKLAAKPPKELGPDEIPVGGGAAFGTLVVGTRTIDLPAFPRAADEARVAAVLAILREATPPGLVDAAAARATYP